MKKLKRFFKKTLYILDDFTYFVPDIFLVLAILSLFKIDSFGDKDLIITTLLFIAYLAISYGEYVYHINKVAKFIADDLIEKRFNDIAEQINSMELVTIEGLTDFAIIVEDEINNQISNLRNELKGGEKNEMDTEKANQEVGEQ